MYSSTRSRLLIAVIGMTFTSLTFAHKPTSDHSKADHYHPDKNSKAVKKYADPKPEPTPVKKPEAGYEAITVYLDAKWGRRTKGAAKAITESHKKHAAMGYKLQDVDLYTENADLRGFFITYVRE